MKFVTSMIVAICLGQSAYAEISNSSYDQRHQAMLEVAIFSACEVAHGRMEQVASQQIERRVDSGVTDVYFSTEIRLSVKVDQGVFDHYKVITRSIKSSAYDHDAKDWGIYSIESVRCELL